MGTGSQIFVAIELFEDPLELIDNIRELEILFVEFVVALLAEPHQSVQLAVTALPLDHKSDRIFSSDRVMRNAGRQQEHITFADRHLDRLAVFLDKYLDITFELIEKFFAFVPMVILPRVRPAHDHYYKVVIGINTLIADRRFEKVPVFVDPSLEIKWPSY